MAKKINRKIKKRDALQKVQKIGQKAHDVAEQAVEKAKEGGKFVGRELEVAKLEFDKKRIRPVFSFDHVINDENMPTLIRIFSDDKLQEHPVLNGAKGHQKRVRQIDILNIFVEHVEDTGIEYYPCIMETVYCKNPYKSNMYISLDEYFDYLKKAKVDELETIAHKLGAKHVKIEFKKQRERIVALSGNAEVGIKKLGAAQAKHDQRKEEFASMEVAAEVDFDGNEEPLRPELVYFKNESDIIALVNMRIDPDSRNKIKSKTYRLALNKTEEMQENTAIQIDAALKKLECTGDATFQSRVRSAQRTVLEYSIVFRD